MVFELGKKVYSGKPIDIAIMFMVAKYKEFNSEFVGGNMGLLSKTPYYAINFLNNWGIENLKELVEIFEGLGWDNYLEKYGKYNESTVIRFYPPENLYELSYTKVDLSLLQKQILGFIADKVSDKEYYMIANDMKEYYA